MARISDLHVINHLPRAHRACQLPEAGAEESPSSFAMADSFERITLPAQFPVPATEVRIS